MVQAQSKGGASKTLAEAEKSARADYHAKGDASTRGRPGRKDPQSTGKSGGEPNVKID